jgi:small subunit ribosomal protein S2
MNFDRETKNMIAIIAFIAAIAVGINYAVVPDADQSMISWSVGLFTIAVLFWIWIRRDDLAEKRDEALQAAEEAARQAEELAQKTQDTTQAKIEIEDEKVVETIEEEVVEPVAEVIEEVAEPVEEPVEEVVEPVAEAVEEASEPDDLTKVEGIGPMYASLLTDAGVSTYAQLASKSQTDIEKLIKDAGKRRPASVETWAEQAGYAAKGDWDGLQKLQDSLDGGRRK